LLERRLPSLVVEVFEGAGGRAPGVVNEHVHAPEALCGVGDEGFDVRGVVRSAER
jgi:hypothetical protein